MANVVKNFRWDKNGFSYKLDGNFTNEQRGYFQKACDKWAPHCELSFTPVQTNPNILASWGKVERDAAGQFVAAVTKRSNPATITFNTDVTSWTKYTKLSSDNNADFFNTCVHDIKHAIGMSHSNNENAQMFFFWPVKWKLGPERRRYWG